MKSYKSYAGIGSRLTPDNIYDLMTRIAEGQEKNGYILRSGGANGADTAFAEGCHPCNTQIFLPWLGYNGHSGLHCYYNPSADAHDIAAAFHPTWNNLSQGVQKLHARNTHIVLGENCDDPVTCIICWTPDGRITGGTGQALRIAKNRNIPVYNLGDYDTLARAIKKYPG